MLISRKPCLFQICRCLTQLIHLLICRGSKHSKKCGKEVGGKKCEKSEVFTSLQFAIKWLRDIVVNENIVSLTLIISDKITKGTCLMSIFLLLLLWYRLNPKGGGGRGAGGIPSSSIFLLLWLWSMCVFLIISSLPLLWPREVE